MSKNYHNFGNLIKRMVSARSTERKTTVSKEQGRMHEVSLTRFLVIHAELTQNS